MDGRTRYLNTDLDLVSAEDLTPLAAALAKKKWSVLHAEQHSDGLWRAGFETWQGSHKAPQATIAAMLKVIEALPKPLKAIWNGCSKRDFNIGFDGGTQPHAFEQTLLPQLLARIAALGASVTITIYALEQPATSA
jgi:hypothetical protein